MKNFLKDESGATAIEYGLIAAAMAVCLLVAEPYITTALTAKFTSIGSSLKV
jgi:pilus assembly protein Flp/PilA